MRKRQSTNNFSNCSQSSILMAVKRFLLRLSIFNKGVEVSHEEIRSRCNLIVSTRDAQIKWYSIKRLNQFL